MPTIRLKRHFAYLLALVLCALTLPVLADFGVQVGAFTQRENAERLTLRLQSKGFSPIQILPVQVRDTLYHAVVVGRAEDRAEASNLLNRLRGLFLPGFIRTLPAPETAQTEPAMEEETPAAASSAPVIAPVKRERSVPEAQPEEEVYQDWNGYVALETRVFQRDARYPRQHDGANFSLALQPEYYREWDNGDQSLLFIPFLRLDNHDPERTHFDIREASWIKAARDWELRVGVRKVFWGVTESVHLVDVINQTDLVEDTDTEDKLGQPMINLALIRDWGTVDLFVLPGFRQRTFPGPEGRLRMQPYVDTDQVRYESGARHLHTDAAIRWSHYIGAWDIGLAHFWGTSREPTLLPGTNDAGQPVMIPYYPIINQTSLDLQATLGNWLWKLEWLTRDGQGDRYTAAAGGFEYTFYGIAGSNTDIGLLSEYLFDDRDEDATTLFQDDVMVGARWTLNDVQSSELLVGLVFDRGSDQRFYNIEASRRFGNHWKLSLEARATANLDGNDTYGSIRDDDYMQAEFAYYY